MANLNLFTLESETTLFVSCQSQTLPSLILPLPHGGSWCHSWTHNTQFYWMATRTACFFLFIFD